MNSALNRIISSKRLPVLFIGSGISKRYLCDYPSWDQLLDRIREIVGITKSVYNAKLYKIKSEYPDISDGKLNQKMASFLQERFLDSIEEGKIDPKDLLSEEEYEKCINERVNFFKMLLSKIVTEYALKPEMLEELELLKKISSKISMVFTTNYDQFIEREIFTDFKVYDSQNKYYFRTNNEYGELYKIHGSITEPNGMIFCEQDYNQFDKSLKLVSSKLINALMDFPIIFLGYSLEDENIKKIMSDFVNSFDIEIIQEVKKYMIMVVYEKGQKELLEGEKQFVDETTGKIITLTTIKTDNFAEIFRYIDKLSPTATTYELRKYKTMVATLISKAAKGEKTIYVQDIDSAGSEETALYIGTKQTVSNIGKSVDVYSNQEIIDKGLNGTFFDYDLFASRWYETKCIKTTEYTPVFLIKHNMSIPFEKGSEKFRANCLARKEYFDSWQPNDFEGDINALKNKYTSLIDEGKSAMTACTSVHKDVMSALAKGYISPKECLDLLVDMRGYDSDLLNSSPFKKTACFAWYMMYEK